MNSLGAFFMQICSLQHNDKPANQINYPILYI